MGSWKRLRWEGRPDPEQFMATRAVGLLSNSHVNYCVCQIATGFQVLTSFLLYLNKFVLHLPQPQHPDLTWPILQTPLHSLSFCPVCLSSPPVITDFFPRLLRPHQFAYATIIDWDLYMRENGKIFLFLSHCT